MALSLGNMKMNILALMKIRLLKITSKDILIVIT